MLDVIQQHPEATSTWGWVGAYFAPLCMCFSSQGFN